MVAASQTGDGCRWVAVRFSKCFFRGYRQAVRFENQSRWFRDGKQVVLRPTADAQSGKPDAVAHLGRSIVCATQQWHAPDSDSTVHRSVGRLLSAVLAGDARRWVASNLMSHCIAKFIQSFSATKAYPEIRWADVVNIVATGTDAFSTFQIWLTFTHSDGALAEVVIETQGYWDMVDTLHKRFPSISPTWYDEMIETPWHVQRVLYTRGDNDT